ncbi:bifunctional DedA family/phosphatase PAP2 family protein [Modicisalibacter tunisiensis]|uniref:bifunctional DedA family/phosphatase PAP2 family protein n=1 Tax=Modicisalibacter tunisiensis TaxID=390637 RepID=UPI001CCA7DF9|nr:bifunctional DedA family/phosphatase PAP2 family protein [Modicisalibacter tunisiensis]MBZ9537682.1 bifunctional DedA family/phosphatase PAP2 family protein [Modicisalibacter tunisiensis]
MTATDWISSLTPSPGWLYLIFLLIALIESLAVVGLLVPGVVLITAAASLAGHHELSITMALLAAAVGAVIGDGLSFLLGYRYRDRIPTLWPFRRYPEWLSRGARFFQRHGVLSVLIGRFVGPVRPVVPLIAGMMHMRPTTFLWSNIGSALLWAPVYVLPGYLLGRTWQQLLALPHDSRRWLILLAVLVVGLLVAFSLLRRQLDHDGWTYRRLAAFAGRHPGGRRLWDALTPSSADHGVPLASLLLLLTSLATLSGWTLWVLNQDGPLPMDQQLQALLADLQHPLLVRLADIMARIGDTYGVIALVAPWLIWMAGRRLVALGLHWFAALGGIALANTLFKHLAGRVRPDIPDYLAGSFSYPSAHTSTAVVLYGLAAAFVADALPPRYRASAYWLAVLICVPMALSRLVIGVHWVSDLVGGALLGLVVCALVRLSYHRFAECRPPRPPWLLLLLASTALLAARLAWLPHA